MSRASSAAGLVVNTAPTRISSITENTRMICFAAEPKYFPTISDTDAPFKRSEIIPLI